MNMSLCRRAAEGVSPYGVRVWFARVLQPVHSKIYLQAKRLQPAYPRVLQRSCLSVAALGQPPSTRVPARVAAAKTRK